VIFSTVANENQHKWLQASSAV